MSCISNIIFLRNLIRQAFLPLSLNFIVRSILLFQLLLFPAVAAKAQAASAAAKEPVLPAGLTLSEKQEEYLVVNGPNGLGVCSPAGQLIIPTSFNTIRYVGEQLFAVSNYREDGSNAWWLLDTKGHTIAKLPDWTRVNTRRFSEGLLNISEDFTPTVFVNKQGKAVRNFERYAEVKDFSNGLAAATYIDRNGQWTGYVNIQGKLVIGPFKDSELQMFDGGVAVVAEYPKGGKPKAGIISTSGKFIVPKIYDAITSIGSGKFWAHKDGQIVVIDSTGKLLVKFPKDCTSVLLPKNFEKKAWIACGFGGSFNNSTTWGYCDLTGKIVIAPRFALCFSFIGNRAVACVKHPSGFAHGVIDRSGKWLVEPKYQGVVIIDDTHWTLDKELPADGKFANAGSNRSVVFVDLLRQHDLIGMPLSDLEKVLGKLESSPYLQQSKIGVKTTYFSLTPGAHCGTGSSSLQFAFDADDKLVGWRITYGGMIADSQPWVTENVEIEDEHKGLQLGNLVPKK